MKKKFIFIAITILLLFFSFNQAQAEKWAFVVLADNRGSSTYYYKVLKFIKKIDGNPKYGSIPIDFILACGDLDPIKQNDNIYKDVFPEQDVIYFPVIGNHDVDNIQNKEYIVETILGRLKDRIVTFDKSNANYYFDWKNIRIIVLDQYSDFGVGNDRGWVTKKGSRWLEKIIKTTPKKINHIFIAMHEPAFPRGRHLRRGGLTKDEIDCWKMFVDNNDRLRAIFVAHTHIYSRMRVKNPNKAASSTITFPDEEGGIYQIDAGNAGNTWGSDNKLTVVWVEVDGMNLIFKTIQASVEDCKFKEADFWQIKETE